MFFFSQKRSWFSLSNRSPRRKPQPTRLTLEALEDRMVPSTFSAPVEQIGQILNVPQSAFHGAIGSAKPASDPTAADGYSVQQMRQAYGWNFSWNIGGTPDGSGQTIAIIDAYDDPNIGSDLQQFDLAEHLPDPPSFQVYWQTINGQPPSTDPNASPQSSWEMEESLDVEWAHAMAPGANIMLVEAYNPNYLPEEAQWAASQPGVSVVSMSWGGNYSGESADDSYFTTPQGHAGVTFVASAGDSGTFVYPASSPNVLAVGGTTLTVDSSGNYLGETVWNNGNGSGGGGQDPDYPGKQGPDVAYNAGAPVQVCDTFDFGNGWGGLVGTSAGAPQWAGLIAVADQARVLQGMGTLDGATQTLSLIHNMPSSYFHTDIPGSNSIGASGQEAVGMGSPIADCVVAGLSGMTVSNPPSNPQPPSSPPSNPQPPSTPPSPAPNPFDEVAVDAKLLVQSFESGNMAGVDAAIMGFESILFNSSGTSPMALEEAFINDILADL